MKLLLGLLIANIIIGSDIYDFMKSDVTSLNKINFTQIVNKNRQSGKLTIVHFYKNMDDKNVEFSPEMENKAKKFKGIFTFGAVNCTTNPDICKKETKYIPNLKLYIPMPYPNQEFEDLNLNKALGIAGTYINGKFSELKDDEYEMKLKSNQLLPKVLIFTDKPGNPLVVRALSEAFSSKLEFFIVRKNQEEIVSDFSISKFPSILVMRPQIKKPEHFKGKFGYTEIFDFLNIYSEQFVPSEENSKIENDKPWLSEFIPELFSKSANEVCFQLEKTLCVIIFSNEKLEKEVSAHIKGIKKNFENNEERGIHFKFLHMDINKHLEWKNIFNISQKDEYIILNIGRRKRFVKGDHYSSLKNDLEKIQGGDARFTPVKGNTLPSLE